ncbi:MAG: 50S ribosomal protein L3 [Microcystis sp.]|uniref:Large ribosomal subunit protein uL3 n=1 Tax=Microcystis aeruginosa G11-04 TaxID=2685956 RepID=A0A966G0K2_MICAE|nr:MULTISPECIES: 50S ribosomal protein L3 [unclassified Microcystis]MCA2762060.1 50S ribosomal protein L3 [Microcystis sp. M151S2]MCU7245752.1 50S ribosomal protein L3 [Microcystis aeruginosa WS75]NCQ69754.1 50S ribosomal protein L3 [Microcystis aeruginosa W13-16]NCQ74288.1 50S ribosomal protein L3 [Microcystis aeruginosa W13-13]NCQ78731.1 50S ribosomal protein L3 [Microcystis aeruginosa W13-15]NCR22497.1 50S ribosomal protein L3 [Microcystis aeruginosa L111-01]NCR26952.1 50S ribosomal prote
MSIGILGTKLGMTQIFDNKTGVAIPVTVVQAGPCPVTQVKTKKTDGYESIQVGYKTVKEKALNKPLLGHLAKAGVSPLRHLIEYRLEDASAYTLGQEITAAIFQEGDLVDVAGTTIGRGFSGYQKRHNFKRGNMTHGSKNHRLPGSTGAGTTPGRVFPGKRMAGQYGATQVTIRKLSVVRIDSERNLILIKGAVPGKPGTLLNITPAKKFGK